MVAIGMLGGDGARLDTPHIRKSTAYACNKTTIFRLIFVDVSVRRISTKMQFIANKSSPSGNWFDFLYDDIE